MGLEENMDVTGNLECAGGECPASAKGVFFDFGQDQVCPNVADDGTVCAASAWISTKTGAFSNAANWKAKKVPKANDVVVAKGNGKVSIQVSGKKATAGHVTLYGTNLVLGSSGMEIVGKLDCSEGGCPKTAKAAKLQLAGYTSKQVRSAAAGKTASQGGLNKPDVAKVLKANKIAYSSKDSSAVLRAKLQQLLNPAASYFLMDIQKMCTDQGQAPQTTKKPGQTTKKPDSGGDVCYASAWMSKVNGYFDDPKKWTRKTLPKTTDIVILAGARVESKKPVTSGHVVITSGIFSITSGRVTVGGNLVCICDKCQSKKLLTFDLGESKMCMVDGQTTAKPKTTKKPGKTTKKPGKTTKKPKKTTPKKTTKKKTTKKPGK